MSFAVRTQRVLKEGRKMKTLGAAASARACLLHARTLVIPGIVAGAILIGLVTTPSSGRAGTESFPCTKHIIVVFLFYQYFAQPGPGVANGCWTFTKPRQDTDSGAFIICVSNGSQYGVDSATNFIFDDTNPLNSWTTENNLLSGKCGATGAFRYGEAMAARSASWCVQNSWNSPCWRRNDSGGSIPKWAELYSSDSVVYDLRNNWLSSTGGWGAYYGNSRPAINVRPDAGNAANMTSHVTWICNQTGDTKYMVLYAGAAPPTVSSTDRNTIFQALNNCTI
jgi:hypothetical protein